MFLGVFVWLLCGVGAAMIASSKNRSGCGWFGAGVLLGPLALLIVGFMAPGEAPAQSLPAPRRRRVLNAPLQGGRPDASAAPQTKECPFCAETILAKAIVCRFCNRDLPAPFRVN